MNLTIAHKQNYKYQDILDQNQIVLILIFVFVFTATLLSIILYVLYSELINACIDEDLHKIEETCSSIELTVIFSVIWSVAKILLITYLIYLKLV